MRDQRCGLARARIEKQIKQIGPRRLITPPLEAPLPGTPQRGGGCTPRRAGAGTNAAQLNIKGPINYPPDTVASHASTAARTFAGSTAPGSVRRCFATAHAAATSPFARMPRAATNAPMSRSFFVRAFLPDAPLR